MQTAPVVCIIRPMAWGLFQKPPKFPLYYRLEYKPLHMQTKYCYATILLPRISNKFYDPVYSHRTKPNEREKRMATYMYSVETDEFSQAFTTTYSASVTSSPNWNQFTRVHAWKSTRPIARFTPSHCIPNSASEKNNNKPINIA